MTKLFGNIIERTKESVSDFTSNPIQNLGCLLPVAMFLTTVISGIVSYIMFIVQGGYSIQVGLIKENGVDGIFDGFTSGTVGLITTGVTAKIIFGLFLVELLVVIISYFLNRGKGMRIAMIVDLVVMVIMGVLSTIIFWIAVGELVFTEEQLYQFFGKFEGMTINPKAILITYAVVCLVALICFLVFTLITKECRWMIGYTALSVLLINTIVPLLFWMLQNIIPIFGGLVVIVVAVLIIKLVIYFTSDHPEDIQWKKEELARAKERSSNYKASAEQNFKEARDGLNIVFSAETKREWARDDLKKADYEDKEIKRLEEDLERLESKFGKQD